MNKERGNISIIILIILLGVTAGILFFYYQGTKESPKPETNMQRAEEPEQRLGGDRDEHGCIGSAGYSWCEAKQKCLRVWEEPCEEEAGDTPVADESGEDADEETIDSDTTSWLVYSNETYNYSFKYPFTCTLGPLPGECKQEAPEDRPESCRCFVNGTDVNNVVMQNYTGPDTALNLATFSISHFDTAPYNPPADADLVVWLQENFDYLDIPDEINYEIDGIEAVKVYTPGGRGAFSQDGIYFIKDGLLFVIGMVDVDHSGNQAFYDLVLSTVEL